MINLLKSELYRLSKVKSFWILNIVLILIALIAPNLSASVNEMQMGAKSATTGAKGFLDSLGDTTVYLIVITGFLSSYICAGFEQRTLQDSIAAGGGRMKIMLAKTFIIYLAGFVMLLIYSLAYMSSSMLINGGGLGIEGNIFARMALTFLTIFIQSMAQITIIILVAFALKKVGIVMAIGISFFTVGMLLLSLCSYRFEWFVKLMEYTPFSGNPSITSSFTASFGNYVQIIVIGMIWIVALLTLTYSIFRKSELR